MVVKRAAVAVCAVAAMLSMGQTASAGEGFGQGTYLHLAKTQGEGDGGFPRYEVYLDCENPGNSVHPEAWRACVEAYRVDGEFESLDVEPGACVMNDDPVTVLITGTFERRPVTFQKTYPNECVMHRAGGAIYAF